MAAENGNGSKSGVNRVFPVGNPRPLQRPRTPGYIAKTQRPDGSGRAPK